MKKRAINVRNSYKIRKPWVVIPVVIVLVLVIAISAIKLTNHTLRYSPDLQSTQVDNGNSDLVKKTLNDLINGGPSTVRLLYMGNSRVARPVGFAYSGIEDILFENGRLAGNGFVIPAYGAQQNPTELRYLLNKGRGMTPESTTWWDVNDKSLTGHAYPFSEKGKELQLGIKLIPGRKLQMASFANDVVLMPRDKEVTLTVQYLSGPNMGKFKVTPIETDKNFVQVYAGQSTTINAYANKEKVNYREIVLPAMKNPSNNRAFTIEDLNGNNVIFRVNAIRDVANGVAVSEMGIGGHGYDRQANEADIDGVPSESWKSYLTAYDPHVIMWMFARNDPKEVSVLVQNTKILMDRAYDADPTAINVLLIDTPSPRKDSAEQIQKSKEWASQLTGYHDAIVIDPIPYLPQDFKNLEGNCNVECNFGTYFINDVHENDYGARTVGNAVWEAMANYIK